MTAMNFGKYERDLLGNHLEFLNTHRGTVTRSGDHALVESEKAAFTFLVVGPSQPSDDLLLKFNTLYIAPWSGLSEAQLKDKGFMRKAGITYMTLASDSTEWKRIPGLEVFTAKTSSDMDVFSEVQARGFLEKQEDYDSWAPFLRDANHRNLKNPSQSFYIGSLDQKPMGVVLTVTQGQTAGIYAVATPPAYRKQGVSTTIMRKAVADARERGSEIIELQVSKGSYAEAFYEKLGFKKEFEIQIFGK